MEYNAAQKWKKARRLKAGAHTFTPNGFTKVSHKLDGMRFQIPHSYYEWGASSWVYSTENQETADYKEYFGTGHVVGYPTNSNPSDNGHYEMIGTPLTYNTTPAYYHADEWIRFNPHPSLWLHGPIRYRTMPDEERIYRTPWGSKVDICENDTWFQ